MPASPQISFRGGELSFGSPGDLHRIRAWPSPQAFKSEEGREWKRDWPEFRFICHPLPPQRPAKKLAPKKAKPSPQLELGLVFQNPPQPVKSLPPVVPALSKDQAFDLLRQTIPEPIAKALAPFQSCQWNPLVFVHFNRGFLDLLNSSPALAYYLANDRDVSRQIYKESRTFLPKLIGTKQTELLAIVGLGITKQMVGIVKKIRADSADMVNIRELQNIRGNPEALKRLSHLESINQGVLAMAGVGGDRLMKYWTPNFLEEVSRDRDNHSAPAIYGLFSQCMRIHWELYPRREFPRMESMARLHAYMDELAEEQQRVEDDQSHGATHDRSPFPPPPIPNSANIQALTSDVHLRQEGLTQHNCVRTYGGRVRSGDLYVYRIMKPERATLAVIKAGGRWRVGELRATCNGPVKPTTVRSVNLWLSANQLGVM